MLQKRLFDGQKYGTASRKALNEASQSKFKPVLASSRKVDFEKKNYIQYPYESVKIVQKKED